MKLKEIFAKVETFNEVAGMVNTNKAHVWFAEILCPGCVAGKKFASFADFRKYIRHEYIKEAADLILNTSDWALNSQRSFELFDRESVFEVYVEL